MRCKMLIMPYKGNHTCTKSFYSIYTRYFLLIHCVIPTFLFVLYNYLFYCITISCYTKEKRSIFHVEIFSSVRRLFWQRRPFISSLMDEHIVSKSQFSGIISNCIIHSFCNHFPVKMLFYTFSCCYNLLIHFFKLKPLNYGRHFIN